MNFGEELRIISNSTSLEERVWELMKPHLRELASEHHPKGCHIVIEGVTKSFTERMKEIASNEDINFNYVYRDQKLGGPNYGTIIWEESTIGNGMCTVQRGISNKLLRVKLTEAEYISINIENLEEKYKSKYLYTYIS